MQRKQQKTLMNLGVFLVILFVGTTLGGLIGGWVMPYLGGTGTLMGTIIAFVITGLTTYVLMRKFGKKSLK